MSDRHQAIVFEQPLNEQTRVCLRIEMLLAVADYHRQQPNSLDSYASLVAIVDLISLLDRSDLRNKLIQDFTRYSSQLALFKENPNIDATQLDVALHSIKLALHQLHEQSGKFAQTLRDSEFLETIRHHHHNPGSLNFNYPAVYSWMQQPVLERQEQLNCWYQTFSNIHQLVSLFLRFIRESNSLSPVIAKEGLYQAQLNAQNPFYLIRVSLNNPAFYPQISVGHYGISIRFFTHQLASPRSQPVQQEVAFNLACCSL